MKIKFFTFLSAILCASLGFAKVNHVRWVQQLSMTGQLQKVVPQINVELGTQLSADDFIEVENRNLANYRFATYLQSYQGVPVKGAMIRTWESREDGHLVLMDAHIEDAQDQQERAKSLRSRSINVSRLAQGVRLRNVNERAARAVTQGHEDNFVGRMKSNDQWNGNDLERIVVIHGKRGIHTLTYSHITGRLKSKTYQQYPQMDIPAMVYPIYEETEAAVMQKRVFAMLKNVNEYRRDVTTDPYAVLKGRKYFGSMMDDLKAATPEGQAAGYWSFSGLKTTIRAIDQNLATTANTFDSGKGVYLEGKYATVSLHPDAAKFTGIQFPLTASDKVIFNWKDTEVNGEADYEIELQAPLRGQPLTEVQSAMNRPARRLPEHDPVAYINDGFDEVQVYYAIDTLMESLQKMGFSDPELSTRPFNAFLFNPDIEMRDNAFYTDDTINFTTYSPSSQNLARDNSTIWHELGHGVMDRLMGDRLQLADTGGLSEGMADFVAQMVIEDVTNNEPFDGADTFRIVNQTNFNMTNESHDDGEAYGGSMRDILMAAIAREGHTGLVKFTDVTLDAMRLARNHPALTANDWFDSILLADQLGHKGVRAPNEMHALIVQSLENRNFRFDRGTPASFNINVNDAAVTSESKGSRYNPYVHHLKEGEKAEYNLQLSLAESETYHYKFPVTVEVQVNGWALQGAIRWEGEDAGNRKFVFNSASDVITVPVAATAKCDFVNRADGACQDYTYFKVFNNGDTKPVAKKRFYIRVYPDGQE